MAKGAGKAQQTQTKTKSKLTPGQKAAVAQGFMIGARPMGALGEAIGTAASGEEIDSAGEAFGTGALSKGLEGAMTGAAVGSAFGPIGAGIGGLGGLLVGGLVGGLSASKEYEAYEKTRKANEKLEKEQKAASSAELRRNLGKQQSDVSDAYLSATPNVEMIDTTGGGISSYDAYKSRMFGG